MAGHRDDLFRHEFQKKPPHCPGYYADTTSISKSSNRDISELSEGLSPSLTLTEVHTNTAHTATYTDDMKVVQHHTLSPTGRRIEANQQ